MLTEDGFLLNAQQADLQHFQRKLLQTAHRSCYVFVCVCVCVKVCGRVCVLTALPVPQQCWGTDSSPQPAPDTLLICTAVGITLA